MVRKDIQIFRKTVPSWFAVVSTGIFILSYFGVMLVNWVPNWTSTTLHNRDRRHAWLSWAQTYEESTPWGDPILADPSSNIPRLALLVPNSLLFLLSNLVGPKLAWLSAAFFGWLAFFFVIVWLFNLDVRNTPNAVFVSICVISFFSIIISFPPLSLNQLEYIKSQATFLSSVTESLPLFYGSSVRYISIPYFFFSIGLTYYLSGVSEKPKLAIQIIWIIICSLFPIVYFYHWIQFAGLLPIIFMALIFLGKANWMEIKNRYGWPLILVLVSWLGYFLVQTSITDSISGREYLLSIGLQEHRTKIIEPGIIIRSIMLVAVSVLLLKPLFKEYLLLWVCLGIYIESSVFMNIQVIVGRTIQPSHFGFLNHFAVALFWGGILFALVNKLVYFEKPKNIYLMIMLFVFIIYHTAWSNKVWQSVVDNSQLSSDTKELLEFLMKQPEIQVVLMDDVNLESNILFLLPKRSYIPWGGLSTIDPFERAQRAIDAWILLKPTGSFGEWLANHSWQLFHMKYGTSVSYSSSLWHNPETRAEVELFRSAFVIPSSEMYFLDQAEYDNSPHYRLDAIIYGYNDFIPTCVRDEPVLFENAQYVVYHAPAHCDSYHSHLQHITP